MRLKLDHNCETLRKQCIDYNEKNLWATLGTCTGLEKTYRRCQLNFDFLKNRQENNNQDLLMNLMREDTDLPLFEFLKFVLIFNPTQRPSFEEVLNHEFLTNF
ncbi:hypothetical protein L3Y34_013771 [Caenorhabditis briggsae]|uniref:Protein kinase domain-containing protein n=1 Tax=Caenorhabditis briggsae TaxID=6238 RepID=A0AAE9CXY8_CAEBR|nr:hypothetical protein L3Y34_013771 [Caenorhabditis briggsae]